LPRPRNKILVTGGAGFIGSHLCERLVKDGHSVIALDNLSSGSRRNLLSVKDRNGFRLAEGDCKSVSEIKTAAKDANLLFHFAANPEVRIDRSGPRVCFRENVLATEAVLEAVSHGSVKTLVFASSSTVYGDASILPTPEDYAPLLPVSIYGACKLASETLIVAHAKTYGFNAVILRLANIIGPRSGHGVVLDFITKLRSDPNELEILGDGTQAKSYLHVSDCVEAILRSVNSSEGIAIYNVGSEDQVDVTAVARLVADSMNLAPRFKITGGVSGGRGWVGDVKNMLLDVTRLKSLGWKPRFSSAGAVELTANQLLVGNSV